MKDVPIYYGSVLQAITHWVAYKQEYFRNHLLPEGAIVAELTQLLSAKLPSGYQVYCETPYKEMDENITKDIRADITVYEHVGAHLELRDVIEVKRYDAASHFTQVIKDSKKLSVLRVNNPNVRLFQIAVGQKKAPGELLTDKLCALPGYIDTGNADMKLKARICKKAYRTKRESKSGTFAVLLEVHP